MANEEQLALLKQGVTAWNAWIARHPKTFIDLRGANLHGANLDNANLVMADLREADLGAAMLYQADLGGAFLGAAKLPRADLREVRLNVADLGRADLSRADLSRADLFRVGLIETDLRKANLSSAILENALLVGTRLTGAVLSNCRIYGISAWDIRGVPAEQSNLIITPYGQPRITVDDLEVAQFIYLLLSNPKVRQVIDTITSKVVLILGRFTPERKAVLAALRKELGKRNYTPVVFDFEGPTSRDITETVSTLAHMARFVIADITDPKSIPQELMAIVPFLPSVPIQPLLQAAALEYDMFKHFERFPWVLPTYRYNDTDDVIAALAEKIIAPAEAIAPAKAEKPRKRRR